MANATADPSDYCTIDTCPLTLANFTYIPSLAGNVTYLAIFAAILIPHLYLGIRYKTWGYFVGMVGGLALEIIGYAGRIQLHFNPFPFDPFLEYLICLTIGPAFLAAAIYLCLGRIVVVYGEGISRVQARAYSILFISCDFLSLVLQAAGGALAATADTRAENKTGVNIMIAGLSTQVVSLLLFIILGAEFAWRVRKNSQQLDPRFENLRSSKKWQLFIIGLAVATVTIFIRCVFRVAELNSGFNGELFNDEVAFMVLEGPMIIIACVCLTVSHPGLVFKDTLADTNWSLRRKKTFDGPSQNNAHQKLDSMELTLGPRDMRSSP
ncbi:unnamed protein product [Zymoseptoria tritici ST99CH_3D7]|uniref:RTA1 domain protein n=2 Tax=Zymoseptoria tritici TaxID=1047171 RepID=F9X4Q3_ZYMTI|nr:uncharacterized protein MYCGRDRAFT_103470 [Zymoseptoria tritici IPO323]EGP90159.1 hypothetical protein MYCGRDRAFT_103470 [Zymoseptoria tritici IPO323]SMQ48175.1 unnamed protein product [Zymoseptoria tritici ST99CH_3D7]